LSRATYQLSMGLVALNALAVTVAYYLLPPSNAVRQVLYILDAINAIILFLDFLLRLRASKSKTHYLVANWGWLDLLGSLPGLPVLRFIRIVRLLAETVRVRRTMSRDVRIAVRRRFAESTLLLGSWLALTVMTVCSVAILLVEADAPNANIKTGSDAIWWSLVTMATVGYGDRYPVTNVGRLVGSVEIIVGVGIFSVLTSYVASTFLRHHNGTGGPEQSGEEIVRLRATVADLRHQLIEKGAESQEGKTDR
jgi:voltage-gated potassium channel